MGQVPPYLAWEIVVVAHGCDDLFDGDDDVSVAATAESDGTQSTSVKTYVLWVPSWV